MTKFLRVVVATLLLVGCGGGGDTDGCDDFAKLEALVKPDGYNFDESNDGYMNAGEQLNQRLNEDLKQNVDDLRATYADC
jgi:hypothetical protein